MEPSQQHSDVGLIGLGLMGRGMAFRLLGAGFRLRTLAHRHREVLDELLAQGAVEAQSPSAIAAASGTVILCLPSIEVVEQVLFAADGIVAGASPGLIVVDCSTLTPDAGRGFAARLARHGIGFVGAPVTRGPSEALRGQLNLLAGGTSHDIDRVRRVLSAFSETILVTGDAGSGYAVKLVNNFLSLGYHALIVEALVAVRDQGIPVATVLEAVSLGAGNSRVLENNRAFLAGVGESHSRFSMATACKDMSYFLAMAEGTAHKLPLAGEIDAQWTAAAACGASDWSSSFFERATGRLTIAPATSLSSNRIAKAGGQT